MNMDSLKLPTSALLRKDSASVGTLHEFAPSRDLKKALECPICNEVPLAPIYTCSSQHTTCGKCRSGFRCGVCNEDLSNTVRNAAVELIVASSSFWCKNLADGCPEIVKGFQFRSHLNECEYRKIQCHEADVNPCDGETIRFKDFFKHLKDVHEVHGFEMASRNLIMSEYSNDLISDGLWPTFYMKYNEEILLRNIKCENSIVYWWFSIIGSTADASRYRVKVIVYIKNDQSSKVEWTVPVYPIRTTGPENNDIYRVAIPASQLMMYCSQRRHPHGEMFMYVMDLKYEILSG